MPFRSGSNSSRLVPLAWRLLAFLLVIGATLPSASAGSDRDRRMRALFKRASALYQRGAHAAALVDFERALEIKRHPSITFNIAQCHRHLGHHELARYHYRLYLAAWEGKQTSPPHLREVLGHIRQLTALLDETPDPSGPDEPKKREPASLFLDGLPDGAVVQIGGVNRGQAPLSAPISIWGGAHEVRVVAEGYQPWSRRIEVEAGKAHRERVHLVRARASRAWVYAAIGAALASAGMLTLGVVQNVRANATDDDVVYEGRRDVAIVGYVGGGIFAAAATASLWLHLRQPQVEQAQARAAAAVALTRGGALLSVTGEF